MPRETVYDAAGMYDVEIGWNKDREDVQVGISCRSGLSIAHQLAGDIEFCTPAEAAAGPHVIYNDKPVKNLAVVINGEERTLPHFNSLWGTLDRAQINRLIRLLRKARDDAYGRDE